MLGLCQGPSRILRTRALADKERDEGALQESCGVSAAARSSESSDGGRGRAHGAQPRRFCAQENLLKNDPSDRLAMRKGGADS